MTNTTGPTHTGIPFEITSEDVTAWVDRYLAAWTSNDADDIAALFTEDGEYHESPYETDWIGRTEIIDGWQGRWDWQQGGWTFEWSLVSLDSPTALITGIGRYRKLGDFDNHWTVTFGTREQAATFEMINNERHEEG
jgi:hypothetical protein